MPISNQGADDLDIFTKSGRKSKETFTIFEVVTKNIKLSINEDKTKFMAVTGNRKLRDVR